MKIAGKKNRNCLKRAELLKKQKTKHGLCRTRERSAGILEIYSRHSLYAYEREISQGFLTIPRRTSDQDHGKSSGGVRTCKNGPGYLILKHHIAHEIKDARNPMLPHLHQGKFR